MGKLVLWIAGSVLAGYLLILLMMYLFQSRIMYHPGRPLGPTPSAIGLPFETVTFQTTDEVQLHGWFIPTERGKRPTILYCHGNAGNISGRLETIRLLASLGLNIFIFDYRGYGKSEGTPTEQGTYNDALAAWHYLTKKRNINSGDIVVMGRSLGGSIAAWLAVRETPAALIIESTFTSAPDLAAGLYPWLPVRQLIRYEYRTADYLRDVEVPIFMAHSREDRVVPFHHGKTLFEIADQPKTFIELRGSHGTGFLDTGEEYRKALQQFVESL